MRNEDAEMIGCSLVGCGSVGFILAVFAGLVFIVAAAVKWVIA